MERGQLRITLSSYFHLNKKVRVGVVCDEKYFTYRVPQDKMCKILPPVPQDIHKYIFKKLFVPTEKKYLVKSSSC